MPFVLLLSLERRQSMKGTRIVAIAFGIMLLQCQFGLTDEQTARLPEDGWWVRFFTTSKLEAVNGTVKEHTIKATYSLVGTAVEDGDKCRWVEVNSLFTMDGKETVILSKFLVSEKDLLECEQPLDKLKRGWLKSGELDVRAVMAGKGITPYNTRTVVFPGIWQKAERITSEYIVDYQQGRLTIPEARIFQVTSPVKALNTRKPINQKDVTEYAGWFHQTASPVIAAAKIQKKTYFNDELNTTQKDDVVIQDYGTGAKSQLPENN